MQPECAASGEVHHPINILPAQLQNCQTVWTSQHGVTLHRSSTGARAALPAVTTQPNVALNRWPRDCGWNYALASKFGPIPRTVAAKMRRDVQHDNPLLPAGFSLDNFVMMASAPPTIG